MPCINEGAHYSTLNHSMYLIIFRIEPPTPEELSKNLAIMQMKKVNAAKLDEHYSDGKVKEAQKVTGGGTFPTYDEYESTVGVKKGQKE